MGARYAIPPGDVPAFIAARASIAIKAVLGELDRVVMCEGDPGVEATAVIKMRDGVVLKFTAALERLDGQA